MKVLKYFAFALAAVFAFSACSKHEIEYPAEELGNDMAEIQLYNAIPTASAAAGNLTYVVLNDNDTIATPNYPINRYNGIPFGNTTRFFVRKPGTYRVQGFIASNNPKNGGAPNLDAEFTVSAGKSVVYFCAWDKAVVLDANFPYGNADNAMPGKKTDTTAWINFVNFWYESEGVPCSFPIQYQYAVRPDGVAIADLEFHNLGNPVRFGEQTGFHPWYIPNKGIGYVGGPTSSITAGYCRIYVRVMDPSTDPMTMLHRDVDYWNSQGFGRYVNHVARGIGTNNQYLISTFTSK